LVSYRKTLSQEYGSLAKKHFQPSVGPQGKEAIPQSVHMVKSGFVKGFPVTRPGSSKVKELFVDTRHTGIVEKKAMPYLKTVGPKDPVQSENAGHVEIPFCKANWNTCMLRFD
jgi:hypothetical protein